MNKASPTSEGFLGGSSRSGGGPESFLLHGRGRLPRQGLRPPRPNQLNPYRDAAKDHILLVMGEPKLVGTHKTPKMAELEKKARAALTPPPSTM
jgi:hypothetical protein